MPKGGLLVEGSQFFLDSPLRIKLGLDAPHGLKVAAVSAAVLFLRPVL
jgi:hypothetical protein